MVVLRAFAPVGPDFGWQLLIGRRLLQGDRLYVDIAVWEVHPPPYTWLATARDWLGGTIAPLRVPRSLRPLACHSGS